MPSSSLEYTVFGFSEQIDWRPLHFVESIPPAKICSACGLVPRTTGFLPCRHVLCKPCYERCERICPLDGELYPAEDVDWKDFPAETMMKREVKCWNQVHGCDVTTSTSEISKHFNEECKHHCTRCPRCSAQVLFTEVCEHLKYHCGTASTPDGCVKEPTDAFTKETTNILMTQIKTLLAEVSERNATAMASIEDKITDLRSTLKASLSSMEDAEEKLFRETCEQNVGHLKIALDKQSDQLNELTRSISVEKDNFIKLVWEGIEQLICNARLQVLMNKNGEWESAVLEQLSVMRAMAEHLSTGATAQIERLDSIGRDINAVKNIILKEL